MSTVAQMIANVQSNAPGLSLTSTNVLRLLNNGLQDLFEEAELEATSGVGGEAAIVTVAGQQRYTLPTNCVKPRQLQWRLSGTLRDVTYLQLDPFRTISRTTTAAEPVTGPLYWTIWGNAMLLWPIPTDNGTAGGDGELVLDFYKSPDTLVNDSDVPDIPTQYHNLLEYYATAMAYAQNEEGQWAQYWEGRFREGKAQMERERTIAERVQPARVRQARW